MESNFLAGPGLGIVIGEFTVLELFQACSKDVVLRSRSPIILDAKLAGGGQILLCKPSALALWNALKRTSKRSGVIPTHLPSKPSVAVSQIPKSSMGILETLSIFC
eukprot:256460-Pelagomonas_calceolata.AAC.1